MPRYSIGISALLGYLADALITVEAADEEAALAQMLAPAMQQRMRAEVKSWARTYDENSEVEFIVGEIYEAAPTEPVSVVGPVAYMNGNAVDTPVYCLDCAEAIFDSLARKGLTPLISDEIDLGQNCTGCDCIIIIGEEGA